MVIEKFKRGVLGEGRNYGMGFAFLKKESKKEFHTLMPFTACKDYLNDFVYIETKNKELPTIYGFKHTYCGCFKKNKKVYLGIKSLHYNKSKGKWNKFDELNNLITNNSDNLIKVINTIEKEFNLKTFTKINSNNENTLILEVPRFWIKSSISISLYTLLLRCFIDVSKEEASKGIEDLFNIRNCFISADSVMFASLSKVFKSKLHKKVFPYRYPENLKPYELHNNGILFALKNLNN